MVCSWLMSEWLCCSSEVADETRHGPSCPFRCRAGARQGSHGSLAPFSLFKVDQSGHRLWLADRNEVMPGLDLRLWHVGHKRLPSLPATLKSCSIFYLPLSGVLIKIADVQGLIPQSAAWHFLQRNLALELCLASQPDDPDPGHGWVQGSSAGYHKYRVTFLGIIVKSTVSTSGLIQALFFFYLAA